MTNEEAKRRMEICRDFLANNYSDMGEPNFTAFNMAIKALEQQPCEDAISRDDAIKIAEQGQIQGYEWQFKKLCTLPSVKPQRPSGKWVNNIHDIPICDQCGYMTPYDRAIDDYEYGNFCPNCGAKMESLAGIISLPSVTPQTGWIPVSEQLPPKNEHIGDVCKYYLIQDEYGDMHVAHLSNGGWIPMNSLKAIGDEVIAWQELPQPYRESEDAE